MFYVVNSQKMDSKWYNKLWKKKKRRNLKKLG